MVATVIIVVLSIGFAVGVWLWTRSLTKGLKAPTFTEMRASLDLGARMTRMSRIRAELRGSNKVVEGKVLELAETGEKWNQASVVDLTIQLQDRQRTEVLIQEAVPMTVLSRLKAGSRVKVLTDPDDPERLAVDWF